MDFRRGLLYACPRLLLFLAKARPSYCKKFKSSKWKTEFSWDCEGWKAFGHNDLEARGLEPRSTKKSHESGLSAITFNRKKLLFYLLLRGC